MQVGVRNNPTFTFCVTNNQQVGQPPPTPPPPLPPPDGDEPAEHDNAGNVPIESLWWGEMKGSEVKNEIAEIYEKIVFWRRNLFMLPTGASGKSYIREVTRLLNAWTESSPLKSCAMKAIHVMPALLLQKPSKKSKSKNHMNALERRMASWTKGEFKKLFEEAEAIQSRLPVNNGKRDMAATSRKFKELMQKGNANGAIKLLTNNI